MLRPLAEALRAEGYRVVMALRETAQAGKMLERTGVELVQGPSWDIGAADPQIQLRTLADVFVASGFHDMVRLAGHVQLWTELVRAFEPRLVIGEYAPGLALAVRGTRPYVTIGSGFTVPPPLEPSPPFRYWEQGTPAKSVQNEKLIMTSVNEVRRANSMSPMQCWAALFGGHFVGVCTYPALDNYRAYRTRAALGPLAEGASRKPVGKLQRSGVFVYLSGLASDFDTIASGLAMASVPLTAHVRDLQPGQEEMLRNRGVVLHTAPRDLWTELPGYVAIVHHGGLSTTHVAIETATPQLILPNSTEQVITGQTVVDLKLGLGLSRPQRRAASIASALCRLVATPAYLVRAEALRDDANRRGGPSALSVLVQQCKALASL
jgi:hypothetical protein